MKSIKKQLLISLIFFSSFVLQIYCSPSNSISETIAKNDNENCKGDCVLLKKVQAIFPLEGEEKNLKSDLNEFTFKYIMVFKGATEGDNINAGHMSIFASDGKAPLKGLAEKPKQTEFKNNYPLDSIITPCNNMMDLCTVKQYKNQVLDAQGIKDFTINPEVTGGFPEKELWNQCLIFSQSLADKPENMFYICSEDMEDFQALKWTISKQINEAQSSEFSVPLNRLEKTADKYDHFLEHFGHLKKDLFYGSKFDKPLEKVEMPKDYELPYKYELQNQLAGKAFTALKADSDIPWDGDSSPPEKQRCFIVPVKDKNGNKIKEYFCVYKDYEGNDAPVEKASLLSMEWVIRINRYYHQIKLKQSQSIMENLSSKISEESTELDVIKSDIHSLAVKLTEDCKARVAKGLVSQDVCDEMLKKAVAEKTKECCKDNKFCNEAVATCIEDGKLPLDKKNGGDAWSDDNPYKDEGAGAVSALDSQKKEGEGKKDDMTSEEAEDALNNAVNEPGKGNNPVDKAKKQAEELAKNSDETGQDPEDSNSSGSGSSGSGDHKGSADGKGGKKPGHKGTGESSGKTDDQGESGESGTEGNEEETDTVQGQLDNVLKKLGTSDEELEKEANESSGGSGQIKPEGEYVPTMMELQKAINTFKRIFHGRKVDKLKGIEAYCENKQENTLRAIGLIPFTARFDPWLEYLGHIRDVQAARAD